MRISKVTTRAGDGGDTHLGDGTKVPKSSPRVAAYGTVDELNSLLGLALAYGLDPEIAPPVRRVQNELFRVGGGLCFPGGGKDRPSMPTVESRHVQTLEAEMERLLEQLPPLEEFLLPGGSPSAAALHVARTVCRRAERLVVALGKDDAVDDAVVIYLNRLSDWLFVLARYENRRRGVDEPLWDKSV
jgi:cob(I)alamin adenosyltransferase